MLLRVIGINVIGINPILFFTALGNLRSSVMLVSSLRTGMQNVIKWPLLVTLSGKCEFIFIFSSCRVLYFLHATMIIPSNQRLP